MRPFDYEALDKNGRTKRGIISAETAKSARRELKSRGLIPVEIHESRNKPVKKGEIQLGRQRLTHKERTLVTRQLATMISASLPVEEALNSAAQEAQKPKVRKILLNVRARVMEGASLSDSLMNEKQSFDALYCAMVAAGEKSGMLAQIMERLADHLEKSHQIRSKIQTALIYPAALAVTAMIVVMVLMTFVVPKVVDQFSTMGQTLPALTLAMISISDFLRDYGLLLFGGLFVLIAGLVQGRKNTAFKYKTDQLLLRLPVMGNLVHSINSARFARTLSVLVAASSPALDALKSTRATISNAPLRAGLDDIIRQVEEGASLSNALRRVGVFAPMVGYMAAAGETSGKLDTMLTKSADYLEQEFEGFIAAALSLLEPAIIILMGAVVAVIVLSILMPILELNTLAAF